MTDEEFHAEMQTAYSKQAKIAKTQAQWDAERRHNHVQVRLPPALGDRFRDYMRNTSQSANQALITIISHYFDQQP